MAPYSNFFVLKSKVTLAKRSVHDLRVCAVYVHVTSLALEQPFRIDHETYEYSI